MGGRCERCAGFVAFALFVVALLSGCSGAQGASAPGGGPPVSSSTATVSGTPSVSATLDDAARARIPKAARAHTAKGAEAFARFYLEQVNKAWMAPDPDLIRPYALASCKTCANYVETAQWLVDHEMRYDRSPSTVGVSIVLPESTTSRVLVQVVNNQEKADIVAADGAVHKTMPHVYAGSQVELMWSVDTWSVHGVRAVL